MKILFLTPQRENLRQDEVADYMSDLLFHGLRLLYGKNCVDFPKKSHMYSNYEQEKTSGLWGRGFSYSRTLEDIEVERTLPPEEADLVIVTVHHSLQFAHKTIWQYIVNLGVEPKKLVIVDGHDWSQYNKYLVGLTPHMFKRECDETNNRFFKPISFAIPESKLVPDVPTKTQNFANIVPGSNEPHWPKDSRKTHRYTTEDEYYQDYRRSRFAFTCKKGGWDCMRHYEILANGCIPIFTDIENCPKDTCTTLPKDGLSEVKNRFGLNIHKDSKICFGGHELGEYSLNEEAFDDSLYQLIANAMLDHTYQECTTRYLAHNFIDRIEDANR